MMLAPSKRPPLKARARQRELPRSMTLSSHSRFDCWTQLRDPPPMHNCQSSSRGGHLDFASWVSSRTSHQTRGRRHTVITTGHTPARLARCRNTGVLLQACVGHAALSAWDGSVAVLTRRESNGRRQGGVAEEDGSE